MFQMKLSPVTRCTIIDKIDDQLRSIEGDDAIDKLDEDDVRQSVEDFEPDDECPEWAIVSIEFYDRETYSGPPSYWSREFIVNEYGDVHYQQRGESTYRTLKRVGVLK